MDTHLQRLLNLCFVLCDRNYEAIKAAGPYACFAIDIALLIWLGKKDHLLNRLQQTHHVPEVGVGGIGNFDIEPPARPCFPPISRRKPAMDEAINFRTPSNETAKIAKDPSKS